MSKNILVADDSSTMVKVIKLTLSGSQYNVNDCADEGALMSKKGQHFDLIVLDYALSETTKPEDFIKKVYSDFNNTSLLILLSNFETIDDPSILNLPNVDKMVKPFDSGKFVAKCNELLANSKKNIASIQTENLEVFDKGDEWSVGNDEKIINENLESVSTNLKEDLKLELSDWEVAIPGKIGDTFEDEIGEIPSIIRDELEAAQSTPAQSITDDFEYPDADAVREKVSESFARATTSALTPLHELVLEEDEDEPLNTDRTLELDLSSVGKSNELEQKVQKEIDPEDLWSSDEHEILESSLPFSLNETAHVSVKQGTSVINEEELILKLKNQLAPMIEDIVKKYLEKKIEEVAWDVIPDLAENLIRKEINKISDSIND